MQENHNKNEQVQPKKVIPEDAQTSKPIATETTNLSLKKKPPIPSGQPQTSNIEFQTESMEVHKHPHHVMHKKKWSEYLLEFFMLFLAVFLGFIAENIREHYAEKKHEREFALQLSEGLKQDTSALSFILAVNEMEKADYDSLLYFASFPDNEEKWKGIYRHIENVNGSPQFVSHQVSFEQVQNIGALRYFKNQDIVRRITEYKFWVGLMDYQQNTYTQFCSNSLTPFLLTRFSANKMLQRFSTHIKANDVSQNFIPSFVSNVDESRLFQNLLVEGREKLLLPQGNLKKMKVLAIELIKLLEKEYHFDNE